MTFKGRSIEKLFWGVQVGLEAIASLVAFVLACHLWIGPVVLWDPEFQLALPAPYLSLLPFIPLIRLCVNWRWGLHETRGALSLVEDFGRAVRVVGIGTVGLICFTFLYRQGFEFSGHSYSRMVFLIDAVFTLALIFGLQMIRHRWQRALRGRGMNLTPCLLVDTGPQALYLRSQLRDTETWGHRIVAEVNIPAGDHARTAEVLGQLPSLVREHGVKEVLISDPTITYHELVDVFLASQPGQRFSVQVLPDLRQCIPNKVSWGHVGRMPTLMFLNDPIRGMHFTLKRALDIIVTGMSLLILAPVFALTVLAIKLESRGPAFFRQERVGLDGRKFWLHKFRSMHVNNDAKAHQQLVRSMIAGQAQAHEGDNGERVYKIKRDPRITRVGHFIRKYSIDELPQLFNVLRGDMSLVGPRPPIAYEVEEYTAWHRKRLSVRPGITGLWQTMGRSRRTYNQMVKLDIFYINHWSLWLDLVILMRTFRVVFRGSDAC